MISLALDRSKYGDKVLSELAGRQDDNSNLNRRQLYDYLRFYKIYPQIVETLSAQFEHLLPLSVSAPSEKVPAVSAQLQKKSIAAKRISRPTASTSGMHQRSMRF
ncbi:hypothetical protein Clim_2474 [Chlorobium limicola DSM 245]|uniref:YhcG N-terminal domain-containing protein n=1 Tax=Chlorobium limicola (strain DSM 245 / NBRC 103803 / 6330) TaxID=290315 RepID=B3EII1_CHLL2|nr:hypothetical protein [Chlorobium limicola]ACD91493.1 hypothetical protein Clim_2474 [Chlorobium limicola DSM 245]